MTSFKNIAYVDLQKAMGERPLVPQAGIPMHVEKIATGYVL